MDKTIMRLMLLSAILWCSTTAQIPAQTRASRQRNSRTQDNFEEYLITALTQRREYNTVLKPESEEDTASDEQPRRKPQAPDQIQDPDVLGYFRDVPREHWSCCMLGKLAGDKGFHCNANFYATRIARRNRNRAHTRKMLFNGPDAVENWGRDLMTTFSRCIENHSDQFHDCCYTATIERGERRKWRMYRRIAEEFPEDQ